MRGLERLREAIDPVDTVRELQLFVRLNSQREGTESAQAMNIVEASARIEYKAFAEAVVTHTGH